MTYVQKRALYKLNKNNPSSSSLIQSSLSFADVADALQGGTARKVERRLMDRGSSQGAYELTPVDQRVAELSDDLSRALETSSRQSDQLVTVQRELDVKEQQLEKLKAELAAAKEKLGFVAVQTTDAATTVKSVEVLEQQKDVIDVLDDLVQEGNRGFRSIYYVIEPLARMLTDGHSVIVNKNNNHGEGLLGLTDILDEYAEKYQQGSLYVEGKIADI